MKRMPPIWLSTIIIFWIFCEISIYCNSSATCPTKPCTVKQYQFSQTQDSMENYALFGYSFKNLSVTSHKNCFEQCAWDCQCISFNYVHMLTESKNNCQLNEENKHRKPEALRKREGHSYNDIRIDYNVKAGTKCTNCYNGCCQENHSCLNGGTCQEVCEANNKRFTCKCRPGHTGRFCHKAPRSCAEIKKHGGTTDGIYTIDPDGKGAFNIFCNQAKAGEAWAIIQRRLDGSVDFYRDWEDYKSGFGDLGGEFWIGLEKIHRLTNPTNQHKLRVELEEFTGISCYAEFDNFAVNGEDDGYRLASLGFYTGSCLDSLNYNVGSAFSTKDRDNDSYVRHCAVDHQGGWWYKACTRCNLNGVYNTTGLPITGIYWYMRDSSIVLLKRTEMKIQLVV